MDKKNKNLLNDYSKIECSFYKKTRVDINNGFRKGIFINKSASIIIPVFNNFNFFKKCLISLQGQYIPLGLKNYIELIIVDDGSENKNQLIKFIDRENRIFAVKLLSFYKNQGRSAARNLGILHSKNEVLVLLDSDMIPEKYFIVNHLLRHQYCKKIATVGFRDNIDYNNNRISIVNLKNNLGKVKPNYKNDFRYKKFIPSSWSKVYADTDLKNFNKTHYLLRESNYFKFMNLSRVFGVWTLPSMFLASNTSVRRNDVIRVGGFDIDFKGWGMEDVYLAYKLIKKGINMIPVISAVAYHVNHGMRGIEEYKKNIERYETKIKKQYKKYKLNEWREEMNAKFSKKYDLLIEKKLSDY